MALEIELTSDLKDYEFTINLDGVVYSLAFRWNTRMQKWFCSIALENGTELIGMTPVISNQFLFGKFRNESLPKGQLVFLDTSNQNLDPTETDLGSRVILVYLEEADIE